MILTAEETLKRYFDARMIKGDFESFKLDYKTLYNLILEAMLYQNKIHVEAALKANDCGELGLIKYPLTNIK